MDKLFLVRVLRPKNFGNVTNRGGVLTNKSKVHAFIDNIGRHERACGSNNRERLHIYYQNANSNIFRCTSRISVDSRQDRKANQTRPLMEDTGRLPESENLLR